MNVLHHSDVNYCNDIPDVLLAMIEDERRGLAKELLIQKHTDWSYEKEYRIILEDFSNDKADNYREVEYASDTVDRIYFGLESKMEDRERLVAALAGREIRFFEMKKAKTSIGIYPYEI